MLSCLHIESNRIHMSCPSNRRYLAVTIYSLALLLVVIHSTASKSEITSTEDTDSDNQEQQTPPQQDIMDIQKCGGLGSKLEKDDQVVDVVNETKGLVEEKTGLKLASIDVHSYKKQLVSGMNYFVKAILKTEEGAEKIAHLRIYKNLAKEIELTAVQLDKSLDDEIVHFQ